MYLYKFYHGYDKLNVSLLETLTVNVGSFYAIWSAMYFTLKIIAYIIKYLQLIFIAANMDVLIVSLFPSLH
jgi:hypothetical protein